MEWQPARPAGPQGMEDRDPGPWQRPSTEGDGGGHRVTRVPPPSQAVPATRALHWPRFFPNIGGMTESECKKTERPGDTSQWPVVTAFRVSSHTC